jgi:hypothetical protein
MSSVFIASAFQKLLPPINEPLQLVEHPGPVVPVTYGMVELHGQGNVVVAPLPVDPAQGIHGNQTVEGLRKAQVQRLELHPGHHGSGKYVLWEIGFSKEPLPVRIYLLSSIFYRLIAEPPVI